MIQNYFKFAADYRAAIFEERTDVKIARGQLALLETLLAAPDRTGSIDDATSDLSKSFDDNGKWRGAVALVLHLDGIIEPIGAVNSRRKARHRGLIRRWRLVEVDRARDRANELRRWLKNQDPASAATETGSSESENTKPKPK